MRAVISPDRGSFELACKVLVLVVLAAFEPLHAGDEPTFFAKSQNPASMALSFDRPRTDHVDHTVASV